MKVLFLLFAMAKRVGELQALSRRVTFRGPDLSLLYILEFVAKTESVHNPLPLSFLIKSLENFVGDMSEDRSLCPVRAMRIYLDHTLSLSPRPRSLVQERSFLRRVILDAGAVADSTTPCAHSV